jgi:FKBP-type peptidyl-prolyl cis-trans isomerase
MTKQIIIGIILSVLLVVGIISFFAFRTIKETENNMLASSGGLKIEDIKVGTGPEVQSGDTIRIHYNGTLLNGKEFDSSYKRGQPFETRIGVGNVIEGWEMGIPGMKVGGKRKLIIPPALAYGSKAVGNVIEPNSTLVFEVELVEIK